MCVNGCVGTYLGLGNTGRRQGRAQIVTIGLWTHVSGHKTDKEGRFGEEGQRWSEETTPDIQNMF